MRYQNERAEVNRESNLYSFSSVKDKDVEGSSFYRKVVKKVYATFQLAVFYQEFFIFFRVNFIIKEASK